ncbi:hypothetical protein [Noviherbaspirillum pedocola]|uniref:Uncharacterized protein n=1 Tax=Noviherbaspirillum pedocola TaxID=2801341 RepID=A0A934SPW0_9BURK|nr:hypothetical protein [Noviherbaspirillum pedocola]MBK4733342.1 hypothetical protein [Noviherbaspirillum pedocola]
MLSLKPYVKCMVPPHPPSQLILGKQYQTYIPVGKWHVFDINGDGWCDWVRNGRQGYRSDVDVVPMIEMIYLGTSTGWRNFETKRKFQSAIDSLDSIDKIHLYGFAEAYGFFQPIPIYRKGSMKPFIVAVSRVDAPAPPPDIDSINVLQWDDDTDNLRYVSGNGKDEVVEFLRTNYCNASSIPQYDGEELIMALGSLCNGKGK